MKVGSLEHHYVTMAYNNAWANHRLLAAIVALPGEAFTAPRTGFFPALKGTLNHILTVDWYYVDALEHAFRGLPVNPEGRAFFDPEEPFADAASLRVAQRDVDQRLIDLCLELDAETLAMPVGILRDTIVHETGARVLAHLFEHQIHHRGQAHAMLSGTQVMPPQLDEFFCAGDAELRAKDFAELGFSEAAIWGP